MSDQSWQKVWESRTLGPAGDPQLARLLRADGFDGFAAMEPAAWRSYVARVGAKLGIAPPCSVFEVGCGSGAFLHDWLVAGCAVGGIDSSSTLLGFAREALPGARLDEREAGALDPAESWDFVVSNGVFLYFPSLEYAAGVLARMGEKARRAVAVLDVPDLARKEAALAMRRGAMGAAEYDARYRGLDHLYIDRGWLESQLRALGFARVEIADQSIAGYAHAPYRYNAFAWKL